MAHNPLWQQSLWDFAVNTYSNPQVEAFCLSLQNQYQANTNILLWCHWLQEENINISREALTDVVEVIDSVSQITVASLREVRMQLKKLPGFTKVQAQVISKHILNAELMVEKVLLNRMQDLTRRFVEVMPDATNSLKLLHYLEHLKVPDAEQVAEDFWSVCAMQNLAERA